jgi:formylglycine-generating enzyme required for sulfatase activity
MEFVWIEALKMWVGKYEVTNGEYRRFMPDYRDHRMPEGNLDYNLDRIPKTWVNFDDAKEYAAWLNWAHGDKMPAGYRARLPSGKEWVTFAQCGDGRIYPWGNEMPPKYGNYSGEEVGHGVPGGGARGQSLVGYNDGYPGVCPVEKSGKNDWGLYGVGGNLAEACATDSANTAFKGWYGTSFYPHGAGGSDKRCDAYVGNNGVNRVWMQGFRLVLAQ